MERFRVLPFLGPYARLCVGEFDSGVTVDYPEGQFIRYTAGQFSQLLMDVDIEIDPIMQTAKIVKRDDGNYPGIIDGDTHRLTGYVAIMAQSDSVAGDIPAFRTYDEPKQLHFSWWDYFDLSING
jgi:hypothetical protein